MKPGVSNFADIIKSTFTLIKITFQNSLIVKKITHCQNATFILTSWYNEKFDKNRWC